MVPAIDVGEILAGYQLEDLRIATLASHSALQILHGAKREGFETVLIVKNDRVEFYKNFIHLIDHLIAIEDWPNLCDEAIVSKLRSLNSILVPHGSYIEYVGLNCAENIRLPIFGLRNIFRVEANQFKKMELLVKAGIPTPRVYRVGDRIEGAVIVKLPGAKGGMGYFVTRDANEILEKIVKYIEDGLINSVDDVIIQEYIVGVTAYYHYFHSPIMKRLEILGADIRYESDVDGIRRLPQDILMEIGLKPTFTVVGNIPLVLRESLLPKIMEYGRRFVEATKNMFGKNIIGPFSLESVIDRDMNIKVFEFSGRIVAGTNLYMNGSPYSYLYWDEPMSTGRRIAREIKLALERGLLNEILT